MKRNRVRLDTGDILVLETLCDKTFDMVALFKKLLKRTGNYIKTKRILRDQYHVFIFIEKGLKNDGFN